MRLPAHGNSRTGTPPLTGQLDPVERYVPLAFKLGVYAFLTVILYQAATTFAEYVPGRPWPSLLDILRTFVFLPLHEGGHFLFMFFGRTLSILGGSFWQIVFPLLWFLIALRQRSHVAPFALFWTGENILDVSLYVRDAPVRRLPLLGGHRSAHDWHNLLSQWGVLDSAESIADGLYVAGIVLCFGAIVAGIVLAFVAFFRGPAPVPAPERSPGSIDDSRGSANPGAHDPREAAERRSL